MSTNLRPRILIVDDEEDLLSGLYDLLSGTYEVEKASNGKEAVQKIMHQQFDLILLDIMMPVMNGYEVAEYLSKNNIDVPFIFLSAKTQIESKIKGLELGAEDYIGKPFSKDELRLRVHKKLYNHEKLSLRNKRLQLIHHNIINPIGAIHGFLDILNNINQRFVKQITSNVISEESYLISKKDLENYIKQFSENTKSISTATDELIRISRNFFELAVLNPSDIYIQKISIPLSKYIYNTIALVKPEKLHCKVIQPIPDIEVLVDTDKINKVFCEIMDNSVLHNHQNKPSIEIQAEIKGNFVKISFTDNGNGIPDEQYNKVFEEFWSGYDNVHHPRGEGIGLWICKKYLQYHNSNIWIEKSEIGKGTVISITLPINKHRSGQ